MKGYRLKGIRVFRSAARAEEAAQRLNARYGLRGTGAWRLSSWHVPTWETGIRHVLFRCEVLPGDGSIAFVYLKSGSDSAWHYASEIMFPWTGVEDRR